MANENVNIVIKAVDKTKKSFKAVTVGLNVIRKAAFSMQSALVAAGAAGFGYLVKRSLDATDALGKMSDKIGISTDQLGGLRYAAELTGVATNTLDMGLQRMVRRVSEAAVGTGAAKDAIKELGLSAKELSQLSPDEQFRAIADAMEGVADQGDKVRLAMSLFDTEGVALVNTLKGGSEALEEMQERAEELGLTMNQSLVNGVEDANDSITELSNFLTGMFNRTVAELAPLIRGVTEAITEWIELKVSNAGGVGQFARDVAFAIIQSARAIVNSIASISNSLISFANMVGKVSNIYEDLFGNKRSRDEIQTDIENIQSAIEATKNASVFGGGKERLEELNSELLSLRMLLSEGDVLNEFELIPEVSFQNALDGLDALEARISKASQTPINQTQKVKTPTISTVDLTVDSQYKQYAELRAAGEKHADWERENRNKALNETQQYLIKQERMRKEYSKLNVDGLQESGVKVVDTLKGTYKAAFDMHKSFAIKDALIDTYKAVSTALSSAPPPANYGLAAVALAQGIANVQTLRATSFREKGGPVTAGSPYIVGEKGPELIVPSQAANVIPNDQLGGGNNFVINISANDTAGFDELLSSRRATLMELINQSLNESGRPSLA